MCIRIFGVFTEHGRAQPRVSPREAQAAWAGGGLMSERMRPCTFAFTPPSSRAIMTASAKPTLAGVLSLPRTEWRSKRNPLSRRAFNRSKALRLAQRLSQVGELRGNSVKVRLPERRAGFAPLPTCQGSLDHINAYPHLADDSCRLSLRGAWPQTKSP